MSPKHRQPPLLAKVLKKLQEQTEYVDKLSQEFSLDSVVVSEFLDVFDAFDKSGNGVVNTNELGTVMRSAGQYPSDDEVTDWIAEIDPKHLGEFDFRTFLILIKRKLNELDTIHEIRHAFQIFDIDNTGLIDPKLLRSCLTTMGNKFTEKEMNDLLREADDGRGMVDYETFIAKMLK